MSGFMKRGLDFAQLAPAAGVAPGDLVIVRQGSADRKLDYGMVQTKIVDAATESATAAATAASASSAQAANDAKIDAQTARDAAQLAAGVYATTAAGLAATTNGKYFSVPAAETKSSLVLYRNNAGAAVEVKRYPSAAGIAATVDQVTRDLLEVAGSAVIARNVNGTLATVGTGETDWANPPPPSALVACDVASIKEKYLVDKWVRFKANVGYTDAGTANSVYLRVPYGAPGEKIPAGKWVQQAMLVHLPNGGVWPQFRSQVFWSEQQFLFPVWQYIEVDAKTRIAFSSVQVPAGTSEQMLVGSQWGIVANDFCVGACYAQVFDTEPGGLRLSLARNTLQARIVTAESYIAQDKADKAIAAEVVDALSIQIGTGDAPRNGDWSLRNRAPDYKWVNIPASDAIVPCAVPAVAERFGLVNWLRYKANTGLSDGGATNSVYLGVKYDAVANTDIPAGAWVQQAFILYTPTGAMPELKGHFVWDSILMAFPSFNVISIDANTKIVWSNLQVNEAGHKTLLIGSQFGVQPFDFYVGGWAVQVYDNQPSGLRINMDKNALKVRVDKLEQGATGWGAVNYAALGDSITWGAGSSNGSRSWADLLHGALAFRSYTKLAVNGACVMPIAGRHKMADEVAAIPAGTDLITVLIGLNDYNLGNPLGDVAAALAKDYEELNQGVSFAEAFRYNLETIRRNFPAARVVVILPLQTRWGRGPNPDNKSLKDFRDAERAIANALAVPVLEAHNESGIWSGGPNLPDGGHPNDAGYELIAGYVRRKLGAV